MNKRWMVWSLCLLLVLPACGKDGLTDKQEAQLQEEKQILATKERKDILGKLDPNIVKAENAFGLRIHQELSRLGPEENVIISPYSLSSGLALAYNGSVGETAKQMESVLGWSGMDRSTINEANKGLRMLMELGDGVTLNIANSIWMMNGFVMEESYLNGVKDAYGAEVKMTDLNREDSVKEMNGWVDQKTNGMIKSIYTDPPGGKAILMNAVYLNGGWMGEFDPEQTEEKNFNLADGSMKKIPMMKQEGEFGYKESDTWQAVRLPYGDGRMHMLVIVPSIESSLDELQEELWKNPKAWQDGYEFKRTVKLELPRFKAELPLELSEKLVDVLKGLGMTYAFDDKKAEFSDMAEESLYIESIGHKVVVDVNEKGTEAAAVTAIVVDAGAVEPQEPINMSVDRPFFFAIEDRDTGAWLFMGSIKNP